MNLNGIPQGLEGLQQVFQRRADQNLARTQQLQDIASQNARQDQQIASQRAYEQSLYERGRANDAGLSNDLSSVFHPVNTVTETGTPDFTSTNEDENTQKFQDYASSGGSMDKGAREAFFPNVAPQQNITRGLSAGSVVSSRPQNEQEQAIGLAQVFAKHGINPSSILDKLLTTKDYTPLNTTEGIVGYDRRTGDIKEPSKKFDSITKNNMSAEGQKFSLWQAQHPNEDISNYFKMEHPDKQDSFNLVKFKALRNENPNDSTEQIIEKMAYGEAYNKALGTSAGKPSRPQEYTMGGMFGKTIKGEPEEIDKQVFQHLSGLSKNTKYKKDRQAFYDDNASDFGRLEGKTNIDDYVNGKVDKFQYVGEAQSKPSTTQQGTQGGFHTTFEGKDYILPFQPTSKKQIREWLAKNQQK